MSKCNSLIKFFREQMAIYHLYTVIPKLVDFIEELTNWYIKLNRPRMKGDFGVEKVHLSLNILLHVLL